MGARYQDLQARQRRRCRAGRHLVTVRFTGWLDDRGRQGKELYNTRREGHTVSFVVGTHRVTPAGKCRA